MKKQREKWQDKKKSLHFLPGIKIFVVALQKLRLSYAREMEGTPQAHESDVMQFCVIAIETAARTMCISPAELVWRFEEQGLIEGRLFKFYDTLHTRSADYVADYIIETLYNYEHDQ